MFKAIVKKKYNKCCTQIDFLKIRNNFRKLTETPETTKNQETPKKQETSETTETTENQESSENQEIKRQIYEEIENLQKQRNPFTDIITGNRVEQHFDYGEYILISDKYSKHHYLLIPKDVSYFNVLTLKHKDVYILKNMESIIYNNIGNEYELFFHCYPFNSIHSLHLHIVPKSLYKARRNDLKLSDVVEVLEHENIIIISEI